MEGNQGNIAVILLMQVLLVSLNGIFACAEIAVLRVSETRLKQLAEAGSKQAKRLLMLIKEPARFLSSIQIAITFAGFLGSAFAADCFSDRIAKWAVDMGVPLSFNTCDTLAVIFTTTVLAYFSLVFGELVPKRLAMNHAEALALGISGPVVTVYYLFKPVVWLLSKSTNTVMLLCDAEAEKKNKSQNKWG